MVQSTHLSLFMASAIFGNATLLTGGLAK